MWRVAMLIVVPFLAGCPSFPLGDGAVHVFGLVTDISGKPVPHVSVNLELARRVKPVTETDMHGMFELHALAAPGRYDVPMNVFALGYKPVQVSVPTLINVHIQVTLARDTDALPSSVKLNAASNPGSN